MLNKPSKAVLQKRAAALKLKHKLAADAAALAIAEQERAALHAAQAAASTEQLRVHHEDAAREAAWEAELDRREDLRNAEKAGIRPSLWRRFCNWANNVEQ